MLLKWSGQLIIPATFQVKMSTDVGLVAGKIYLFIFLDRVVEISSCVVIKLCTAVAQLWMRAPSQTCPSLQNFHTAIRQQEVTYTK